MASEAVLAELRAICAGAQPLTDGPYEFIHLPGLRIQTNGTTVVRDGLLCMKEHSGYATRLFLAEPIPGKGQNWTMHTIVGRQWHTPSWSNVTADLPAREILACHLRAYR